MSVLERREEAGGTRYYLDNRAIHCGTRLELLLPGNVWVRVCFEMSQDHPVLYMPLGGGWETWQPPAGMRVGDVAYERCKSCQGTSHLNPGDTCPACAGSKVRVTMKVCGSDSKPPCASCDGTGKVQTAQVCDDCIDGRRSREIVAPEPHRVVITTEAWAWNGHHIVLRWPLAGS